MGYIGRKKYLYLRRSGTQSQIYDTFVKNVTILLCIISLVRIMHLSIMALDPISFQNYFIFNCSHYR